MRSSSLLRIIFFVVVAVFSLNFVILLVYFPISSSPTSPLSSSEFRKKNIEPVGKPVVRNLRKKYRQQQRQQPPIQARPDGQQDPGQDRRTNAVDSTFAQRYANRIDSCRTYGCPVYPPELTTPHTNQTIRKALESSGYSLQLSSSKASEFEPKVGQSPSESGSQFEFASDWFATLSQQGKSHKINQDRAVFVSPFLPDLLASTSSASNTKRSFLTCIFDGHGSLGHEVAQELVDKFPLLFGEKLSMALKGLAHDAIDHRDSNESRGKSSRNNANETILVNREDYDATDFAIHKALNETFLEVNEKGTASSFLLGGSTASVSLQWGSKLYVANVGDSQTIVVMASPPSEKRNPADQQKHGDSPMVSVKYETRRDKANQPAERARIEKLGGKIHVNAKGFDPRVIVHSKAANDTIGLAMSRSLGDWEWKKVGVIAEPTIDLIDLSKGSLSDSEKVFFLLAASDGFWDLRQKNFYATQLVSSFAKRNGGNHSPTEKDGTNVRLRPLYHLYDILQRITPKVQKGYRDDITAMIVNLL